jgi:magnesium and cobalt exporter, CNNM family
LEQTSVIFMFGLLLFLIVLSGFFSSAEIGMMSLNRYRLRHRASKNFKPALRVCALLARQEKLLGVILIGNTITNLLASSIVTIVAARFYGELGVSIGMVLLTFIILIFAEIAPKTVAALYPERVAYIASLPLSLLQRLLFPLVTFANSVTRALLFCVGINSGKTRTEHLSGDELRTLVSEAGDLLFPANKDMLMSILDLERVTVEDVMIPRHEIVGIDLMDPWGEITEQLHNSQHTRLPVFRESLDSTIGFVHLRTVMQLVVENKLNKASLESVVAEMDYIPEGTQVSVQLLNFKKSKQRSGLVVDEYGDIQGLVVIEDIIEEIVGEFTTNISTHHVDVHPQEDGSYIVDGRVLIRELNRDLAWSLPQNGPKTLSGLITEYLEFIPPIGTCMLINGYPIEVIHLKNNRVRTARIFPHLRRAVVIVARGDDV